MGKSDYYEIDGKRYDRVTAVLGYFQTPELVDWKLKVGRAEATKTSKAALKVGTAVHKYAETGKLPAKCGLDAKTCVEAYNLWVAEHAPVARNRETTVRSERWGVAGTYDLLLADGTLVDIKTSREIKPEYWVQLAAYALMENGAKRVAVLRLDKNMGFYEYEVRDITQKEIDVFEGLLTAYRYFNQGGKDDNDDGITETEVESGQELDEPEVPDAGPIRSW